MCVELLDLLLSFGCLSFYLSRFYILNIFAIFLADLLSWIFPLFFWKINQFDLVIKDEDTTWEPLVIVIETHGHTLCLLRRNNRRRNNIKGKFIDLSTRKGYLVVYVSTHIQDGPWQPHQGAMYEETRGLLVWALLLALQ